MVARDPAQSKQQERSRSAYACCFCGEEIADSLFVEFRARWTDSYDAIFWDAHESCVRRALHPDRWGTPFRGASGRSAVATYLEEGPGKELWEIALAAGFSRPLDDYPRDGTPEDFRDLEDVLSLTGRAQLPDLHRLLFGARLWAPAALALVAEEAKRRGLIPRAIVADVVAIIALLANPIDATELKQETNFVDELADAISGVAVKVQETIPRVFRFRLLLPNGAFADPASFLSTVQSWSVGETFTVDGKRFRIVAIVEIADDEPDNNEHLNAVWTVQPVE